MAEVSFLPSANTRKRASDSREASCGLYCRSVLTTFKNLQEICRTFRTEICSVVYQHMLYQHALSIITIKFPYNARFDWLKERTLSENKVQVNDIKLAFEFSLGNFDKFDSN